MVLQRDLVFCFDTVGVAVRTALRFSLLSGVPFRRVL